MNLQEGIYQLSEIASTHTHVTKFKDGRNTKDVVMFNIADDPYELQNIFEENLELGVEMIEEIKVQGQPIFIKSQFFRSFSPMKLFSRTHTNRSWREQAFKEYSIAILSRENWNNNFGLVQSKRYKTETLK